MSRTNQMLYRRVGWVFLMCDTVLIWLPYMWDLLIDNPVPYLIISFMSSAACFAIPTTATDLNWRCLEEPKYHPVSKFWLVVIALIEILVYYGFEIDVWKIIIHYSAFWIAYWCGYGGYLNQKETWDRSDAKKHYAINKQREDEFHYEMEKFKWKQIIENESKI